MYHLSSQIKLCYAIMMITPRKIYFIWLLFFLFPTACISLQGSHNTIAAHDKYRCLRLNCLCLTLWGDGERMNFQPLRLRCALAESVSPLYSACVICSSLCAACVMLALRHFVLSNRAASPSFISTSCFRVPLITEEEVAVGVFSHCSSWQCCEF